MPERRKLPPWVWQNAVEAAYLVLYNEHRITRRQVIEQLDRWERHDTPNAAEWNLWGGKAWAYFSAVLNMTNEGVAGPLPPPASERF